MHEIAMRKLRRDIDAGGDANRRPHLLDISTAAVVIAALADSSQEGDRCCGGVGFGCDLV